MSGFYVYILASDRNGTLYIGVTNDVVRRVYEHREGVAPGFTKRYRVTRLVYFETCDDPETAIQREKHLKQWRRSWKIDLVTKANPDWIDLYPSLARSGSILPERHPRESEGPWGSHPGASGLGPG